MAFSKVEQILAHTFNDRSLLDAALTHASYAGSRLQVSETYQRLEFLGDRVLALVIADALIERFPTADEGELARRLNHLVKADTCAFVAKALGLDRYVRTDDLNVSADTRAAKAVLADVCEAVIAAIYLDAGFDPARTFILRHWHDRFDDDQGARRDPKTALQEWAHAKLKDTPAYKDVGRDGPDHAPIFTVEVVVAGLDPVLANGKSKRDAQQAAALAMLRREGVWNADNVAH